MYVEIISVGNEVVYGHTINTNASYIAQSIQKVGMIPRYVTAVCDDEKDIGEALVCARKRADVIIFTGGLGSTKDDLTKETVCKALGKELTILPDDCGTALGYLIQNDEDCIILLPGPPKEMKKMFNCYVMPILKKKSEISIETLDIKCFGIDESELATKIHHLLGEFEWGSIATYVGNDEVTVRITAYQRNYEQAIKCIQEAREAVEECLENFVIGYNEERLEEKVVKQLLEKKYTISTVESCTGGLVAATLINCGGVSECLREGVITYSNEAKTAYVGVKEATLQRVGAVSEETAREMAEGIRRKAQVDIGLSTTGIAGPSGGTSTKPVGLVYIGIAMPEGTEVFKLQLNGTRQEVREKTVKNILFQLSKKLK